MGYISGDQLEALARGMGSSAYGHYLTSLIEQEI
jgi:hypothetical protein